MSNVHTDKKIQKNIYCGPEQGSYCFGLAYIISFFFNYCR